MDDQLKDETILYTYDAGFNMTSEKVYDYTPEGTVSGTPESRTFTYASGWKDQLVSVDGQALTYDGAGNLVSYNGRTFTWKNGRQLAGTTGNGSTVSYTYDHNGMRVSKTVDGVKHTYVYAGTLMLQEKATGLDLKFSYDSLGNPIAVLYNNGEEYYYVKNLQGDIVGLVNKDGEWVVEYFYDAWGNILSTTGSLATTFGAVNPFRYRGYYYDAETGLYYVSSRYYDPGVCRFISPDSGISGIGGQMLGYNMYIYCFNNPVNMSDPWGNWPRWISAAVAVVATVVAVVTSAPVAAIVAAGVAVTYATQIWHYDVRQSNNTNLPNTPKEANDAGWRNSNPKTPSNPNGDGPADDLHQYSSKDKSNVKYVSPDGYKEVIFNNAGKVVNDPRDIGTYNFIPSGNVLESLGHGIFDVIPWFFLGNTDDDWGPIINIFID